jgi:mono/diheme cytochrome c family protein
MRRAFWFVSGAATLVILLAGVGIAYVKLFAYGFSARAQPTTLEVFVAKTTRRAAIPVQARDQRNPVPASDEILAEARAHWADHCAGCHANNGSGDTEMGKHLYPPAPDMRNFATQNLSDAELFYIIQNGIRLTGMPAWGTGASHDEQDSWKLVRFIRHLPKLTAEEEREMEGLNPKTTDELKEEQEEKEFLNGGQPDEQQQHAHHH